MRRSQLVLVVLASALVGSGLTLVFGRVDEGRDKAAAHLEVDEKFVRHMEGAPAGTYSSILLPACVKGGSEARITSVRLHRSSDNVRLREFAIGAPGYVWGDTARMPLKRFIDSRGHGSTSPLSTLLQAPCASSPDAYDRRPIVLELAYTDASRTGAVTGAEVEFTVNGHHHTVHASNGVTFCTGRETSASLEALAQQLDVEPDDLGCEV